MCPLTLSNKYNAGLFFEEDLCYYHTTKRNIGTVVDISRIGFHKPSAISFYQIIIRSLLR